MEHCPLSVAMFGASFGQVWKFFWHVTKMDKNGHKCQNGQTMSKMVKIVKNCQKWSKMVKMVKNGQNGQNGQHNKK